MSLETVALIALLLSPIAMIAVATRVRKAREQGGTGKPWDKPMRNAMLVGLSGTLLLIAGLYAYAIAVHTKLAPLFGAAVVLGVVLVVSSYRMWMRAVSQIPDDQ